MLKLLRRGPDPGPATAAPEDDLRGLVASSLAGSREAQRTLLSNLGPSMLQMVRRVLGTRDPDVEDVFQEAAWGLVRALPSFRATCSTRHFACRVALLTALKARRRRPRATSSEELGDLQEALSDPAEGANPGAQVLAASRRRVLRRLLDELPEAQASALLLHCVGGFSIEEIATSMDVPLETTRSRLRLAKASLRDLITADPAAAELFEVTP